LTVLIALFFGFLQGLRHAFEPDHVVAVSTMLAEHRRPYERVRYALSWGIGHASTIACFGAILMVARAEVSARLEAAFEVAVSCMLIAVGARALRRAHRSLREARHPLHDAGQELGPTPDPHRAHTLGALAMGMVHGLAGSGALTAFVVARMPSVTTGVLVLLIFGMGATAGMSLLAGALGAPLSQLLRRRWGAPGILAATGSVSLVLGLLWIVPALARTSLLP
jgi:cytochrome c biogenesis protein CcdA